MLKLKLLSSVNQDAHFKLLKGRFDTALAGALPAPYDQQLIDHLKASLNEILLGTPAEIEAFAGDFVNRFSPFSVYAAKHRKGTAAKDNSHKNTLTIIKACFDYDWFSDQTKGWGAYALVEAYRLRICPYCQANHVNFHVEKAQGKLGAGAFKMRPPLDHYLPKSAYPYLAVSLSNLVPSCAQCNSGVKTANDPRGKGFAHPLDRTSPITVRFTTQGTVRTNLSGRVKLDELVLTLTGADGASTSHIKEFRLQERYGWYRHEIKDLFDRHDQHDDLNRKLQGIVCRELYVLGFLESQAEERSLGFCLRDVYKELSP